MERIKMSISENVIFIAIQFWNNVSSLNAILSRLIPKYDKHSIYTSGNTGVVAPVYPHFSLLLNFHNNRNLTYIQK